MDMFMPEVLATEVVAGASLVVQPCEWPVGVAEGGRLMYWCRECRRRYCNRNPKCRDRKEQG